MDPSSFLIYLSDIPGNIPRRYSNATPHKLNVLAQGVIPLLKSYAVVNIAHG